MLTTGRMIRWGGIAGMLAAPAAAMRLTDQVAWTAADFMFAATLLIGAGLAYELAARRAVKPAHRLMIGAALAVLVAAVWAQGAVGIF